MLRLDVIGEAQECNPYRLVSWLLLEISQRKLYSGKVNIVGRVRFNIEKRLLELPTRGVWILDDDRFGLLGGFGG